MTHEFTTLSSVLNRCSAKVADQLLREIRAAVRDAALGNNQASNALTHISLDMRKAREARAAERRARAAERRAAKKAAKEAAKKAAKEAQPLPTAEQSPAMQCGSVAKRQLSGAEAPVIVSVSFPDGEAFSDKMVDFLRRCPAQQMRSVLNSYTNLLCTGSLTIPANDHDRQFLDNFLYLARIEGRIESDQEPTVQQTAAFIFENPALPLPRAERRRIERLHRKQLRQKLTIK